LLGDREKNKAAQTPLYGLILHGGVTHKQDSH